MKVRRLFDLVEFRERATPLLLVEEARHNLLLGLITTLVEQPEIHPRFQLWLVEEGEETVHVGLMTPPFNLAVSRPLHDSAIAALARAVNDDGVHPPGVTGSLPEAE